MTQTIPPLVLGNWKMHMTATAAAAFAASLGSRLRPLPDREIAVAPPFTAMAQVRDALEGSGVLLAAQDLFWEDEGPYTGEISGLMLQDAGVTYVLVAHSERRRHLEETDRIAGLKVGAALRSGLRPILCVGEDEMERAAGRAESVVRSQIARGLALATAGQAPLIQLAYEPVWAIGTGHAATTGEVEEMHAFMRHELKPIFKEAAAGVRILYGGSVTPENIDLLMRTPGVDGVLVGGASLETEAFARIAAFGA
jgi:triosephosphate isomerase (TIM)